MAKAIQFGVYFVSRILLVPVFLLYWGPEKYGIWLAVWSFFNLLLGIDAGHGNFVSNEFTRFYHTDIEKAKEVLGAAVRATFLSGFIQMAIIGFIAAINGFDVLLGGEEYVSRGVIWGVFVLVLYRTLAGSIKGIIIKVINPTGQIDRAVHVGTGEKVLDIIVLLIGGIANWSIFTLCVAIAIQKGLYSLFVLNLIRKWVPGIFPWWQKGSMKVGIRNYFKSIPLTISYFLEHFSIDGVNLLVSAVMGPIMLPVVTTIRALANLATRITSIMLTPLQPELTRYHFTQQGRKIVEALKANWLLSGLILCSPFVILAYFIPWLYGVWTGGKIEFDEVLYICFVGALLLLNYGSGYIYYLRAINHIRGLFIISLIRAVLLFGLSWVMMKQFGLIGLGLAMIVTELITSVNIPGLFVKRSLKGLNQEIPVAAQVLALVAIASTVGFLLVDHYLIDSSYLLGVGTLLVLVLIAFLQWMQLGDDVRERITGLVRTMGMRLHLVPGKGKGI